MNPQVDRSFGRWVNESLLWEILLQWPFSMSSSYCHHVGLPDTYWRSVIWGLDSVHSTFLPLPTSTTLGTVGDKMAASGILDLPKW